jgi:hypothetical protein
MAITSNVKTKTAVHSKSVFKHMSIVAKEDFGDDR